MFLEPLKVYDTIKSLKTNKTPGNDGISTNLIKYGFYYILASIVDISFQKGIFPDAFKWLQWFLYQKMVTSYIFQIIDTCHINFCVSKNL